VIIFVCQIEIRKLHDTLKPGAEALNEGNPAVNENPSMLEQQKVSD
jgi:hypothetical protein